MKKYSDVDVIENSSLRMAEADGVILGSPTYASNVLTLTLRHSINSYL